MEFWMFEITLILARNLEVRETQKTKVYAKISIAGHPNTEKRTPVDKKGGANPAWNFTTTCKIGKQAVEHDGVMLLIELYRSRTFGDQYIGELSKGSWSWQDLKYPVNNGGSHSSGVLKFSYRFRKEVIVNQPSGGGSALGLAASGAKWVGLIITVATGIDIPFSWEGV
ncbi:hypothetical protein CK203_061489 [Vitis vinifera]|uniref:C2 domain-containing protein n=1 Tax=Vitis vinifera TaxID=29760 RepID=A0A438GFS9_VITVI|nr:hypothetical protein CK203_061489 [Vitis vinifera]